MCGYLVNASGIFNYYHTRAVLNILFAMNSRQISVFIFSHILHLQFHWI